MANRQRGNPGAIQKFEGNGQIASTPDYVVGDGGLMAALTGLGGNAAGRLKQMADQAASREGELAGLDAGQRAGQGYLDRRTSEVAAGKYKGPPKFAGTLDDAIKDAAKRNGVSADALRTIAGIESGGNVNARNPNSSAKGPFQFVDGTARDYGLDDPFDAGKSADAAARLMKDNASALRGVLGREPTTAELYLAHQQGGQGAARLLANPGAKAADIVGADAVTLNGGTGDMTAGDFAAIWLNKAGGAAPDLPAGTALQPLSTTPLALRDDGTIRGGAYDQAASNAYGWRMQQGLSNDLAGAYDQFKDDPAGWAKQSSAIRDQYLQGGNFDDPRMREVFDKRFAERTAAYSLDIATRHEARLVDEQQAATGEGLDAMRGDLERQAFVLGANPHAEQILGTQSAAMLSAIDAAIEDHVLTPQQGAAQRKALQETMANARVSGVFASLPTPAQKEAFATGLLDDWAKGEGPMAGMPMDVVKATSATLFSQARGEQNELTAKSKAEAARIKGLISDDITSMAGSGKGIDFANNAISTDKVKLLLGEEGLAAWQHDREFARKTWEATNGMELETPTELNSRLVALKPVPGQPGFADQQTIYAATLKHRDDLLEERLTDPLGQAARGGAITLAPIDTSSSDALTQSLTLRKQQAQVVSDMYGTPPSVFRPSERAAFAKGLLDNPAMIPAFAAGVAETFGDLAPKALAELSDAGPELAHAAGITLATGDTSVAQDVANVLAGRRDKTLNVKMPTDTVVSTAASIVIGPAMGLSAATRSAVVNTAGMLFEAQAGAVGFDPSELKDPNSAAFAAYENAVNRALGMRMVNGQQYGGLTQVNGTQVVAPSFLQADRLQQLVDGLGPADLASLPPIASSNGIPLNAGDLRGAHLVTVGDGLYAVALGDPNGLEPNYVQGADGKPWQLDIEALQAARSTQPAVVYDPATDNPFRFN